MSIALPRDCRVGKISVHPINWEDPGASTAVDWFIHYRFQDPSFRDQHPKGYQVKLKGMNDVKGLVERRRVTRALLENEKRNLMAGYNPIQKRIVIEEGELEISPASPFIKSLEKARNLLPDSKTKKEIRKALVHVAAAITQLRYDHLPISDVKCRHIDAVLEKISRTKQEATGIPWGPHSFNHYRSYLIMLFKKLRRCDATELDIRQIEKRRTLKKIRKTLTSSEIEKINDQVKANHYTFWRFIHIFFHSGARMSEMMQVRFQDVQLEQQRFLVTIKKGRGEMEQVYKTITRAALPLWTEVIAEASPGQYLFARGLKPGNIAISEWQVTKRWRLHVKKKLGIEADFYSLKHKNTTEIVSRVVSRLDEGARAAADQNSHKGAAMVIGIYDTERDSRKHDQLKDLGTPLQ
jgi:integrase